jgi:hypothetical protein
MAKKPTTSTPTTKPEADVADGIKPRRARRKVATSTEVTERIKRAAKPTKSAPQPAQDPNAMTVPQLKAYLLDAKQPFRSSANRAALLDTALRVWTGDITTGTTTPAKPTKRAAKVTTPEPAKVAKSFHTEVHLDEFTCRVCGESKDHSGFAVVKVFEDGSRMRRTECRSCEAERLTQ